MSEDALVDDVGIERGLRDQVVEEMRDILLAIGHESLVIARASAEGDDDGFTVFGGGEGTKGGRPKERGGRAGTGDSAEKLATAMGDRLRDLIHLAHGAPKVHDTAEGRSGAAGDVKFVFTTETRRHGGRR